MLKINTNTLMIVIAVLLLAISGGYIVQKHIEESRTQELVSLIADEEVLLTELSQHLKRNSVTTPVSAIVRDCAPDMRARYDSLLSRLSELSKQELIDLERIFVSCAYFYPDQQAIMTMLLDHEFNRYSELLDMLATRTKLLDRRVNKRLLWSKLVDLETIRSGLSLELVEVQKSILDSLLDGTPKADPKLDALRRKANEILDRTVTTMNEIEAVRKEIDSP